MLHGRIYSRNKTVSESVNGSLPARKLFREGATVHSRKESHSKPGNDPPKNHRFESRRKCLKDPTDSKDQSAREQRHSSSKNVSDATCQNRSDY